MIEELYEMYAGMLAESARGDSRLKETISRYAEGGSKPSKAIAARFIGAFREYLLGGKEKRVLMDADDRLRVWNGRWHERVGKPKLFLKELARRTLARLGAGPVHQEFTSGLIAYGLLDSLMATDAFLFKPDRRYIAMRNGVLDLKGSGKGGYALKEHSPARMTDIILDFDYYSPKEATIVKDRGEAYAENYGLWEKKLAEIIPAREMRECFQDFCGSMLTERGEYRTEYVCILIGPGSNGKSVAVNAVAGVFGEDYTGRYSLQQLFKGDRRDRFVADLQGKLLNVADDISAKGFDSADFKKTIGGDGIEAMRAYATDPVKVRIPPILGCCNSMPEVKDDTWGYHRRILQIGTARTFGEQTEIKRDPRLPAKLLEDASRLAILHWMLEGRRRYARNNGEIRMPEEVKAAVAAQMEESSPYRVWLRDCGYAPASRTTEENGRWIPVQTLYEEYAAFCAKAGFTRQETGHRNQLSGFLRREGYRSQKMRPGTMHYLVFKD